jgi:hypothetical protein
MAAVMMTEVFDAILAGTPARDVVPAFLRLAPEDRQNVLCTVCAMREEIARNCQAYATEVHELLTAQCPLYIDGTATCLF